MWGLKGEADFHSLEAKVTRGIGGVQDIPLTSSVTFLKKQPDQLAILKLQKIILLERIQRIWSPCVL